MGLVGDSAGYTRLHALLAKFCLLSNDVNTRGWWVIGTQLVAVLIRDDSQSR